MIQNEARYEAAKQARIRNNARIGKERRWKESNADAQRVSDFLFGDGEFKSTPYTDAHGEERLRMHPVRKAAHGAFFAKMVDTLLEWGALTDKQTAVVVSMIERAEARVAECESQKAQEQAACEHVGTVGERITIEGAIFFTTHYETDYGTTHVTGIKDAAGNIFIQKGVRLGQRGDNVWIKATVKEHTVRDGVKQTIICRPKDI